MCELQNQSASTKFKARTARSRETQIINKPLMDILEPTLYALFAGSATLIGLFGALFARKLVKRYSFIIVSLAAGVLLGTGFLHLLPEAQELVGDSVFLWLLGGFAFFYVLESLVGAHCCQHRHGHKHEHQHVLGSVAGVGIFFHSILDGVAIAIGFEVSSALGIITAIAVLIHELPEGIFTLSILLHAGMSKKRATIWTILVALATPFGAFATLLFFPDLSPTALGALLAISAGSFIYISASDLIPESHHNRSLVTGAFVIAGILLMFFINTFAGHSHVHSEEDHDHSQIHESVEVISNELVH